MELIKLNSQELSPWHLEEVARIHYSAYSKRHFTSIFSFEKLKEYYHELIKSSDLSLFYNDEGKSVGFIIAGLSISSGVARFISNNRLYIIMLLITHPRFLIEKVTDTIKGFLPSKENKTSKFRLMSIAVDSAAHSKGYGKKMLEEFELCLAKESIKDYGLSVRKENERGVKFYYNNGFILEAETADSYYFRKDIKIN
jgi:ribosomal protein S18 acetylase RimI-like enzyme